MSWSWSSQIWCTLFYVSGYSDSLRYYFITENCIHSKFGSLQQIILHEECTNFETPSLPHRQRYDHLKKLVFFAPPIYFATFTKGEKNCPCNCGGSVVDARRSKVKFCKAWILNYFITERHVISPHILRSFINYSFDTSLRISNKTKYF